MGTGTGQSSRVSSSCQGRPEPVPIFHKLSPDGNLELELGSGACQDLAANELDEAQDIAGAGSRLGHNEVGIAVAYLGSADSRTRQAGLDDERGRALAAWILEDPPGRLKTKRLI